MLLRFSQNLLTCGTLPIGKTCLNPMVRRLLHFVPRNIPENVHPQFPLPSKVLGHQRSTRRSVQRSNPLAPGLPRSCRWRTTPADTCMGTWSAPTYSTNARNKHVETVRGLPQNHSIGGRSDNTLGTLPTTTHQGSKKRHAQER